MKAFNNVPHYRLFGKLWKQRVHVNGQFSKWSTVSSGIPQGSVLDPFFVCDLNNDVRDSVVSDITLYSDDSEYLKMYS